MTRTKKDETTMGCLILQENKSKNYLMQWVGADGKRCYQSSGTSSKIKARKKLDAIESKIRDGAHITRDTNKCTFEDGLKLFERDQRKGNKSGADTQLGRVRKHLAPFFAGRKLRTITSNDVGEYFDARQKTGAANASIVAEVRALRRIFKLANVVWPEFECPKLDNARTGFFERIEFDAVIEAFSDEHAYWRALLTFAYYSGWRIQSEIATLTWSQVDLVANIVTLGKTKNGTIGRTFHLNVFPELRAMLVALDAERRARRAKGETVSMLVFHRNGDALTLKPCGSQRTGGLKAWVREEWTRACKAAGVEERIPHDLRRTAVRNLLRANVDPGTAMEMTGHKTMGVFMRYNIVNDGDLAEAAAKLAAYDARVREQLAARTSENDAA